MSRADALPGPHASTAPWRSGTLALWVAVIAFVAHLGLIPGAQPSVLGHEVLNFDDPEVLALARERSVAELLTDLTYYAYKPVYFLSLKVDLLFDEDGAGFGHVVNLLLFALAAGLLTHLLGALTRSRWLAFAAGVLFAVHPAHVESVAWLSGRKDVLSLVLALLAHLAYRRARWFDRVPVLAPVLLALAGLTKGTVWTWAGLFALDEAVERTRGAPKGALARLLPSLLVALVGIGMDAWFGARAGPGAVDHGVPTTSLAAAMAGVHARYVALLLAPLGLSILHDPDPAGSWSDPWSLLGAVLAVVAVVLLVVALRRGRPLVALALGFWVLGLAPVNNVWPRTNTLMAERYLLVGAVGLYLGLAWALGKAGTLRGPLLGVVATALGVLAVVRTGAFADSERVWADALRTPPGSALAWVQRAQAAAGRRDTVRALDWAQRALARADEAPRVSSARVRVQAHLVVAAAHLIEGRIEPLLDAAGQAGMAARAAGKAGTLPADVARRLEAEAEVFRGQALEARDHPRGAEEAYEHAAALDPENATALHNLATMLGERGRDGDASALRKALALVTRARQLEPSRLDLGLQHATLLAFAGRTQEALGLFQDLESRHGPQPDLLLARAQFLLDAGPPERALKDLERLRREHPTHPRASRLVYDLYVVDARRLLERARREGKRDLLSKALERAQEAQRADADQVEGWLIAGDVLFEQGKLLEACEPWRRALTVDGKQRWIRTLIARATTLEASWLARRATDPGRRLGAARVFARALGEGAARIDLGLVPLELELPLLRDVARRLEGPEPQATWAVGVLLGALGLAAGDDAAAHVELGRVIAAHPEEHGAADVLEAAVLLRAGVSDRSADVQHAAEDYALVARLRPNDPVPRLRGLQVDLRAALARRAIAEGQAPSAAKRSESEALLRAAEGRAEPTAREAREALAEARRVHEQSAGLRAADAAVVAVGERIVAFADATPELLEAGLLAAESEMRRQLWVAALRRLNGLSQRFPEHPSVLRGQAAVYLNQYLLLRERGLVEEAFAALHRAVVLDPRDPRTALDASGARRIGGDLKGALAWAKRARIYENMPGGPAARELAGLHAALGEQALDGGDRASALKAVEEARAVDPSLAAAWILEGRILLESPDARGKRDPTRALPVLMKAKELEPANLAVDRLLSKAWYQRGMATAVGMRLLRDPPHPAEKNPEAFAKLPAAEQAARHKAYEAGRAEQEGKRKELRAQAVENLSSALRLDPEAEHAPQARALLDGLTAFAPEEQAARAKRAMEDLARGAGHLEVGEAVDAYLAFEKVLEIDPEHRKASFYLVQAAYLRLVAGGMEEAERSSVTNRAFERLQALDALDPNGVFPLRHLYRALLNETLFRRTKDEDSRQAALRAYDRYVARAELLEPRDEANLKLARTRREELARLEAPR